MRYRDFIESIKESRENVWFENSELHHITPRCMGGDDRPTNLIYLTYREHFIAHKLLMEENPGNRDLILAVHFMSSFRKECTPEEYAEARRLFIESQKGDKNPLHNPVHNKKHSESLIGNQNARGRKGCKASEIAKENLSKSLIGNQNALGKTWTVSIKREYRLLCTVCGKSYLGTSSTQKYCPDCNQKRAEEKSKSAGYHLTCKMCGSKFVAPWNSYRYCDKCREV